MSGDNGAERVKNYSVPMAAGLSYNYASKQVNENVLAALEKLADEAQLADKFKALYNGEVVNTGEKRLVLHHMTRGQLGDAAEQWPFRPARFHVLAADHCRTQWRIA